MNILITSSIFGLTGGLLRALVGVIKNKKVNKKTKVRIKYLITTVLISGLIGMVVSLAISTNSIFYLIAGYAGIDFLENLRKIYTKR